jgi:hypothetical protein
MYRDGGEGWGRDLVGRRRMPASTDNALSGERDQLDAPRGVELPPILESGVLRVVRLRPLK